MQETALAAQDVSWCSKFNFHGAKRTPFYAFGRNDDAALGAFVL
jgi:hypothetical protein